MKITENATPINVYEMGQRMKQARMAKKIKSMEMAELLYMHKDVYSRMENGRSICNAEQLYLISQYLEVSVDYLLSGEYKEEIMYEIYKLLEGVRRQIVVGDNGGLFSPHLPPRLHSDGGDCMLSAV